MFAEQKGKREDPSSNPWYSHEKKKKKAEYDVMYLLALGRQRLLGLTCQLV